MRRLLRKVARAMATLACLHGTSVFAQSAPAAADSLPNWSTPSSVAATTATTHRDVTAPTPTGILSPSTASATVTSNTVPSTGSDGMVLTPAPVSGPAGANAVGTVQQVKSDTPIRAEVSTHKVVLGPKGRVSLQPAVDLRPGDVMQISGSFYNPNWYAVKFDPQIALPTGTGLVVGSIAPKTGRMVGLKGAQAVGWKIANLESGATVVVTLRARVLPPALP